jgi:hypothetical protein
MPEEGVAWIKEKFGIDFTRAQFSTYKSAERAKKGNGVQAKPAALPRPASSNGSAADLARQVKVLVQQYGAGAVKEMVSVFSD